MISVYCHTNLDISGERWPTELPQVPQVDHLIQSETVYIGGFQLALKVVSVIWKKGIRNGSLGFHEWYADIELHDYRSRSINEFQEWYDRVTR